MKWVPSHERNFLENYKRIILLKRQRKVIRDHNALHIKSILCGILFSSSNCAFHSHYKKDIKFIYFFWTNNKKSLHTQLQKRILLKIKKYWEHYKNNMWWSGGKSLSTDGQNSSICFINLLPAAVTFFWLFHQFFVFFFLFVFLKPMNYDYTVNNMKLGAFAISFFRCLELHWGNFLTFVL